MTSRFAAPQVDVVLIGCGAVAELFHAPALAELQRVGRCGTVSLIDPDARRVATVGALLRDFRSLSSLPEHDGASAGITLVASPARYHAEQAIAALEAGWAVLCEKPMAATVREAESMVEASKRTGRPLCIGMIRRHLPAVKAVRHILQLEALGKPLRFTAVEGGLFNWPAVSGQFFKREHAHGGVLHDVGVHVLDLCALWFGEPESIQYEDDAMGNMEANCHLHLSYSNGIEGDLRLSRDWSTMNRTVIQCEHGWIAWRPPDAQRFEVGLENNAQVLQINLAQPGSHWGFAAGGAPAMTFQQCLVQQIVNALDAAAGREEPEVSGEEAVRSLRVIEECYRSRQLMPMPWLPEAESTRARDLAQTVVND